VNQPRARLIAYYLPQFHVVSENEAWWGKEFTDWVNVRRARPLFSGHYQPRVPMGGNYYDLTDMHTLHWQIELARSFGIQGFCHYHYWFEGRRLLQRPTDMMIEHRELDFPFCLAWVNASWARRWKGDKRASPVLVRQTYARDPAGWMRHFECLWQAWSDPRHLQVDGKPVFLIYYPHAVPRIGEMLDVWRSEAQRRGLPGIHFVAMQLFAWMTDSFLRHFDAVTEFQPAPAMFIPDSSDSIVKRISIGRFLRGLPPWIAEPLWAMRYNVPTGLRLHDYEHLWRKIVAWRGRHHVRAYPGAFVDWDNTARYAAGARIVRGATPDRFRFWLEQLVGTLSDRPFDERLLFINAWNEWAEGAYLEPDERYGHAYLEAVSQVVFKEPHAAGVL